MQRRRRAGDEDGGEDDHRAAKEEALRQLEMELEMPRQLAVDPDEQARALEELPPVRDEEDIGGSVTEPNERQLVTPSRPRGDPMEFRPLFSEEQILAMDAVQQQAPHLYGGARRL